MSDKPIDDGGPAFPTEQHECQDGTWNQTTEHGMSLRDYFAAHALGAMVGRLSVRVWSDKDGVGHAEIGEALPEHEKDSPPNTHVYTWGKPPRTPEENALEQAANVAETSYRLADAMLTARAALARKDGEA